MRLFWHISTMSLSLPLLFGDAVTIKQASPNGKRQFLREHVTSDI